HQRTARVGAALWGADATETGGARHHRAHPYFPCSSDQEEGLQARLMEMATMSTHQTTDLNEAPCWREVTRCPRYRAPPQDVPAMTAADAKRFYQGATIPERVFANALRDLKLSCVRTKPPTKAVNLTMTVATQLAAPAPQDEPEKATPAQRLARIHAVQ